LAGELLLVRVRRVRYRFNGRMAERFVLALDQGTTSSRALLFDHDMRVVGSGQQTFRQHYPEPGWVEHDPLEIWQTQRTVAADALRSAGVTAGQVAAVGITNQRETTLLWHRATGRPVHNAIVWQDRRTAERCAQLRERGVEGLVSERTGLRLDPYFSATKLAWLLEHVDGAQEQAAAGELCFGTVDSWLVFQLTGGKRHVTDATNAARTMLYDIHRGQWDDELLELFDVPRSVLPEVCDSSGVIGAVAEGQPAAGAPIAGIAGDQQAALFGQLCREPGSAKNTYGTGCFLLMHTGTRAVRSRNQLLTTIASRIDGVTRYALEGSVFTAGAVVQWLRDELQLVGSPEELDRLAASVPDAGGVVLVPAFTGLGAPQWDPHARGAMFGLTRGTSKAQICRAALDGIALQTAELIECMAKDSGVRMRELRVDGGASRSDVLLQVQADLVGVDVVRPANVETTAIGAAFLAGLAVGYWTSDDELRAALREGARFRSAGADLQALRDRWHEAVKRSMRWAN
jgi:glycerol kinase